MKARLLIAATLAAGFIVIYPAGAVDTGLLNLVMPDAKVLAGVNVEQAKISLFGQYVLSQVQTEDQELKKLEALTGFDPTRDVRELLIAANSTADHTGLFLARGTFNPGLIAAAATAHNAVTESYNGITIIEDPQKTHGVAFPDSSLAIVGDIANVKAAIDRLKASSTTLPASLITQVNQWSGSQDAWGISAVPPASLHPPSTAPKVPMMNGQGAFQNIQSAAGGVKFGALVVVTTQAQAATAQDAQQMADALKLLANLAQMQAGNEPAVAALAQSLTVSTSGATLNASVSLPEDQLQQVLKQKPAHIQHGQPLRKQR